MAATYRMYIDGEWTDAKSGRTLGIINPATEEIIAEVPYGSRKEAAGCTTVSRPASQTPLATMELFRCLADAGAPAGTVNLVTGPPEEITQEFIDNRAVRKISFTGSTEVGKQLMRQAADQLKKLSLELGGHAPLIVFPDVDVEAAAKVTAIGKFRNMGQVCISPNRIYVHDRIRKDFTDAAVEFTRSLKLGNGLDPAVDVGPLFEERNIRKTVEFITDATSKGARVLAGGRKPEGEPYRR